MKKIILLILAIAIAFPSFANDESGKAFQLTTFVNQKPVGAGLAILVYHLIL